MAKYNAGFDNWYPFLKTLRPPLLPALLTPFTYLHHFGVSMEKIFTYIHIFSVFISFLFIVGTYLLFRKGLRDEFAAIGTFLLMIQPGFVAYSFETMVDIPSGWIMILSIFIYLRYTKSKSNFHLILLCLLIGLGVAMKYPMILSPLVFFGAYLTMAVIQRKSLKQIIFDPFYWKVGLLSCLMYITVSVISLLPLHGWTLESIYRAIQPYFDHIPTVPKSEESRLANLSFLYTQMTAPIFILMCVGLLMVWKRKNEINIIMFMWLIVFLIILSAIAAHYEYRYLFLLIPPCYYFCAYSMQELYDYAKNKWNTTRAFYLVVSASFIFLIALPVFKFTGEIKSLNSGFYENDFQRRVAKASTKSNGYVWLGNMYSSYQSDAPFHIEDPFYKIYHYWVNGITFYTGKTPKTFLNNVHYSWLNSINSGDILIYNPIRIALQTKFLPHPEEIPPLSIGKVFPMKFFLANESENQKIFINKDRQIELNFDQNNSFSIVIDKNIPISQNYFLWLKLDESGSKAINQNSKTIYKFIDNTNWKIASNQEYFDRIKELAIINYEPEDFYYDKNIVSSSTKLSETK
ncbi:MAG: glycosyltransferase family 39 protein [Nitrospinales bacterium]